MTDGPATNAAERIAATLRYEVIGNFTDGEHLGSADEFAERFGVSVPTVRQALRILEAEGLVRVRRGNSGGYFAATPSVRVITQSAASLLQRDGVQLTELLACSQIIAPEVAALAAANPDVAARVAFAEYVEQAWAGHTDTDIRVAGEVVIEMGRRLAAICGNAPLALFAMVLANLVVDLQSQYVPSLPAKTLDDVTRRTREGQLVIARAVGKGDIVGARLGQHLMITALYLDAALDPASRTRDAAVIGVDRESP
jgi:DNA-binding FadR family transcriptional regulator